MRRPSEDPRYPDQAGTCSLSVWSGRRECCRWCDEAVAPGFAWCGNRCEDAYRRNHWWDLARQAALVRDGGRCVTCGLGPDSVQEARSLLRALVRVDAMTAAELWRSEAWLTLVRSCEVEVHHLVPRQGAGYGSGCHHHLDGLVTLCHRHHAEITASQRRFSVGKTARRAG